ncbi:MAG: xanthine dehydrogenase molybdopterin binding subunit [Bacteroidetes bacterium 4572_77]|nr:MAG: xanthine dehydrogenase molybdopterin binding subunit [Bacteroidetes bacterium 4572_77]
MKKEDLKHNSIAHHISGKSVYVNDIPLPKDALHAVPFVSSKAHAKILKLDFSKALEFPGVSAIIDYKAINGQNQMGPVKHDELCLAIDEVNFIGQCIAVVAAKDRETAQKASLLIEIEYEELPAIVDLKTALEKGELLDDSRKIESGDIHNSWQNCEHILEGSFFSKGQEHWYLETQTALCQPLEGKEMKLFCSTQHPSETQAIVSKVLNIPHHLIEVEVKRIGGAFGGKETQANHIAVWTALMAQHTAKTVKMHLSREMDQCITGKRHAFLSPYKVGFSSKGKIEALEVELNSNGGASLDLSTAIMERAMFHLDNAYYIQNFKVTGKSWKTNLPPNTAFRGFGAPQSIALIENIIDRIARFLSVDALEIRQKNFYTENQSTPYGQPIKKNPLHKMLEEILVSSSYHKRQIEVVDFNKNNKWKKRGLALVPVKFGISFTTSFLNQAGALVQIYQDGSINVNHGGIEMGQGLHTKIREIASDTLGILNHQVIVSATNTSKVPNTSATAASSGTDLNGKAVENACLILKERLSGVFEKEFEETPQDIHFSNGIVRGKNHKMSFGELCSLAYLKQVSLSSTGFYRTPDIYYDRIKGRGKPFHYFTYGFSVSEVEIDVFTGKYHVCRTDILHDVGKSINGTLDIGQIEGAFVQGIGWVCTEELQYDKKGELLSSGPDTYKIPTIDDIPKTFIVNLCQYSLQENNIKKSKAVGEPPFMHAISVWLAIKNAISSVSNHQKEPQLSIPATPEAVLLSLQDLKVL